MKETRTCGITGLEITQEQADPYRWSRGTVVHRKAATRRNKLGKARRNMRRLEKERPLYYAYIMDEPIACERGNCLKGSPATYRMSTGGLWISHQPGSPPPRTTSKAKVRTVGLNPGKIVRMSNLDIDELIEHTRLECQYCAALTDLDRIAAGEVTPPSSNSNPNGLSPRVIKFALAHPNLSESDLARLWYAEGHEDLSDY